MKHFINRLKEDGPGHNVPGPGKDTVLPKLQVLGRAMRPSLYVNEGVRLKTLVKIQRAIILRLARALFDAEEPAPDSRYLKTLIKECEGGDAEN